MAIYIYGSIIASILFYINLVSTLKQIHKEVDTASNTFVGSLLLAFIMFSIIAICAR